MVVARFLDICLDAHAESDGPAVLADFWAQALDARPGAIESGGAQQLTLPGGECAMWINPVPEPPPPVKTRAHLDLRLSAADPAPLVGAGARVLRDPGGDAWWVLADPEGNEFCAFPPREGAAPGVFELVVDSADGFAQAQWWAEITGGTAEREQAWGYITGASGFPWRYWVFNPVPEPKTVKNRLHWDVRMTAPTPDALLDAGANLLRSPDENFSWWILADPEGNEFCAFPP
jgi:hypothetical protein